MKDRIQRLLVPGYRPALRLTWRALLASLLAGGGLLFLSAVGTRVAIAAVLSPQERIDRIEKKMTEFGENPASKTNSGPVSVSVHLRTSDGSPLPKNKYVLIYTSTHGSGGVSPGNLAEDGGATNSHVAPADEILIVADFEGYAPALAGPFDGRVTNRIDAGELILGRGFEVSLHVSDADSGAAVTNAALHTQFFMLTGGQQFQHSRDVRPDAAGRVTLPLCIDQPLVVTVDAPGYEFGDQRFERLSAGQTLEVKLKRGQVFAGRVVDKATGEGLPGAILRVIHEKGAQSDTHYQWTDDLRLLARTDADGRFTVDKLRRDRKFWLGISAPEHESVLLEAVAGAKDVMVKLGPELIVRGRVIGSLDGLRWNDGDYALSRAFSDMIDNGSWGNFDWVRVRVSNGVASFQFTNGVAGPATLSGGRYREERNVTAPIEDWVVDLTAAGKNERLDVPKREVVFRFKHPSGVPPRGSVQVEIPPNSDKNQPREHSVELEITNGEARTEIAIGGRTSIIGAKHMVGYWFERFGLMSIEVTNGAGPQVVEIPLVPAGEIYAKARNADGTPAGGLMFGVSELKRAPGVDKSSLFIGDGDRLSDDAPRKWVSGPLPLGGTYQVGGSRGNMFSMSKPIKLTEANPDAEVELQFPPGRTFDGVVLDPDGKPLRDAELETAFNPKENTSFGLKSVFTDQQGRFRMENMTPEFGEYSVRVNAPGAMAERVKLDFGSQPQTIRLKRGRTLAGRVLEATSVRPVISAKVRAFSKDGRGVMQTTQTDTSGKFIFDTLEEGDYQLSVYGADDPNLNWMKKVYKAGQAAPVVLEIATNANSGLRLAELPAAQ